MIIYGEYLFLENLITGMIILFFTGKILGEKLNWISLLFCGICCGLYAFILFMEISGLISLLGKVLFSMVIAALAFRRTSLWRTVQGGFVFLAVTVLYGGFAIAILTSFGWVGVTAAAGVYLPPLTYITVTAVAAMSAVMVYFLMNLIRAKRMDERTKVSVKVSIDGSTWFVKGMIDSGNMLRTPFLGSPVCIVRKHLMEKILEGIGDKDRRYTVVPYHSVGVEHGLLEGYRMDEIVIEGEAEKVLRSPVVAVCEENSFFAGESEMDMLLPAIVLERGIYGDDRKA